MKKHQLRLLGGRPGELRIPSGVLLESLGALIDGARLALRFAVEGESLRKGSRPAWLEAACEFEVTGLSSGSAVVALEARRLCEIDAARFGEEGELSQASAIDVFGRQLASTLGQGSQDVLADAPLLEACARFARASGKGFEGMQLEGVLGLNSPLLIRAADAELMERLRDETPGPRATRVTGTLDTVSASRSDIILQLVDGTKVLGRLEEHKLEELRSLLGREVVLSGMAQFRPSGRLFQVIIEDIALARPEDKIFQKCPRAGSPKLNINPKPEDTSSGVAA